MANNLINLVCQVAKTLIFHGFGGSWQILNMMPYLKGDTLKENIIFGIYVRFRGSNFPKNKSSNFALYKVSCLVYTVINRQFSSGNMFDFFPVILSKVNSSDFFLVVVLGLPFEFPSIQHMCVCDNSLRALHKFNINFHKFPHKYLIDTVYHVYISDKCTINSP